MEDGVHSLAVGGGRELGRQIVACVREGVVVCDPDARIVVWNPFMVRLTGIELERVVGRRVTDVLPSLGPAGINGLIESALRGETDGPLEVSVTVPGREHPARLAIVATPYRDANGSVAGVIGTVQDLRDRRQVERSLRESEARLMRAQAIAHVGDWELDLRERTMWGSPEASRLYGLDPSSPVIPLERVQAMASAEDRAYLDKALADLIAGVAGYDVVFRIVRASDGETRVMHSNAEVVRADDGTPLMVVGVVQDVTELKAAELEAVDAAARLRAMVEGTVNAMAVMVEIRDPYTAGHQRGVARLAVAIGRRLGLDQPALDALHLCGALHDIGKVAIPAEILTRPGLLEGAQLEIVRAHAAAGAEILASIDFGAPVAEIVGGHHERLDGSGYPGGLVGDEVPLEARIIAVADVVEAMASHRPYRPALGIEAALAEIRGGSGRLYDPAVAEACLQAFAEGFRLEEHTPPVAARD